MISGLLNAGKAAAPKLAAGGLFGAAATSSEDAEAAAPVLRFLSGIDAVVAAKQLRNKLNKERGRGISGEKTVADYILRNSTYQHGSGNSKGWTKQVETYDGGLNGEAYTAGINGMADSLIENTQDPYLKEAIGDWRTSRLDPNRHKKHGRGHKIAASTVAAGGAGGANSAEMTQAAPTTPEERGFPSWDRYETGPSHGLPTPTWGDVGESLFTVLGAPMSGLHGLARGAYGLLNGEGLAGAGAEAAHMMGTGYKDGKMVPGYDTSEGWERYGKYAEDMFKDAGVPAKAAKGIGLVNQWAPQAIFPF